MQMVGVLLSFFLVDTLGRRPLLIYGSLGSSLALALLVPADWLGLVPFLVLGMCAFIFAFRWAGRRGVVRLLLGPCCLRPGSVLQS